jgi:plasmid stabilization system protein ParE
MQWAVGDEGRLSPVGRPGCQADPRPLCEASPQLADRFFKDLLGTISKALSNPLHFPPIHESLRRANLADFPYHFLYEEKPWGIKVMVVRHHRRNPRYGRQRQ